VHDDRADQTGPQPEERHRHADEPEERRRDLLEIVLLEALLGLEDAEEEGLQDDEGQEDEHEGQRHRGHPAQHGVEEPAAPEPADERERGAESQAEEERVRRHRGRPRAAAADAVDVRHRNAELREVGHRGREDGEQLEKPAPARPEGARGDHAGTDPQRHDRDLRREDAEGVARELALFRNGAALRPRPAPSAPSRS